MEVKRPHFIQAANSVGDRKLSVWLWYSVTWVTERRQWCAMVAQGGRAAREILERCRK